DEERQHRYEDDEEDDLLDLLRAEDLAHEVTEERHRRHPADASHDVEHREPAVAHLADARDDRRERANGGHEASEHDRLAAVRFVTLLGRDEMILAKEQ